MNQNTKEWAEWILNKVENKLEVVALRNKEKVPYTTIDGKFDDWSGEKIGWWTNGFWGGIMWQMYNLTKKDLYKSIANDLEEKMDGALFDYKAMDHDSGFRWLPTSVANYKLTGNLKSYNRSRLAADNLAGRFNPAGNFIRAWNDEGTAERAGWAIIDCMMNLPLLYWAYEDTKDYRYYEIAVRHADTAMKNFIRENGSSNHIVEFDIKTGDFVRSYGGQGYKDGSAWTRGQAWALYGFALSYYHTKEEKYLDTSCKVADYFESQIPVNGLIPVDFDQPVDCSWEDSTASAIAACGYLMLSDILVQCGIENKEKSERYYNIAVRLIKALTDNRCDFTTTKDNIVEKCTAAYNDEEHEFSIIYGDYYYIEALCKLSGKELFIW